MRSPYPDKINSAGNFGSISGSPVPDESPFTSRWSFYHDTSDYSSGKIKNCHCNRCVEICQVDVFVPNSIKGRPPVVLFPGECWYCGRCVVECASAGAIKLRHPVMNQVHWVEKGKLK